MRGQQVTCRKQEPEAIKIAITIPGMASHSRRVRIGLFLLGFMTRPIFGLYVNRGNSMQGDIGQRKVTNVRANCIAPVLRFAYSGVLPIAILSQVIQVAPTSQFPGTVGPKSPWWQPAILILLLGWLYYSILSSLVAQWWQDPNFSHGFFVPAFPLFSCGRNVHALARMQRSPSWWGLPIVIGSLAVCVIGVLGAELFLSRISLILLLAGLVIFFLGWN